MGPRWEAHLGPKRDVQPGSIRGPSGFPIWALSGPQIGPGFRKTGIIHKTCLTCVHTRAPDGAHIQVNGPQMGPIYLYMGPIWGPYGYNKCPDVAHIPICCPDTPPLAYVRVPVWECICRCYMGAIKFRGHDVVHGKGGIFIARKQDQQSLKIYFQKQYIYIGKNVTWAWTNRCMLKVECLLQENKIIHL